MNELISLHKLKQNLLKNGQTFCKPMSMDAADQLDTNPGSTVAPDRRDDSHAGVWPKVSAPVESFDICHASPNDYSLINIPTNLIRVDPRQPRKYLPDDLRQCFDRAELTADDVIRELLHRANNGDQLAIAYVDDIRELAGSIRDNGLRYPIQVAKARAKTGEVVYRLVDGERRFWACMFLTAMLPPENATRFDSLSVLLEDDAASGDDIIRAQWAANLQRADVSAVDFAEFVCGVRDRHASRMQIDARRCLQELGDEAASLSSSEAVIELTIREIERLTGKGMSRAGVFRYLAIAEKVNPDAKAVARARHLSLRQLTWIARLEPREQITAVWAARTEDDETRNAHLTRETEKTGVTLRAGRPRKLDSRISLLTRVTVELGKDTEATFGQADAGKLQELRMATADAIESLQRYARMIDRQLNASQPDG